MRLPLPESRPLQALILLASTLVGAFAATLAVTSFATFRSGPVTSELGRLDGGVSPHAVIIELGGVEVDLGVPLPGMWGSVWLVASGEQELLLGETTLERARDYLAGTAYGFASFTDASWQVRSVPGEGRPADPTASGDWTTTSVGQQVELPAQGALVLMRTDARRPVEATTTLQFRADRYPLILSISLLIAAACLALGVMIVRGDARVRDAGSAPVSGAAGGSESAGADVKPGPPRRDAR